jgi:putative tricarboxylic transport membrane protein
MDVMQNVFFGLQVCLQPENLLYCFIGVLIGTLIGVLPGIGPMGAMSILLPATYGVTPVGAIIMMGGSFYPQ